MLGLQRAQSPGCHSSEGWNPDVSRAPFPIVRHAESAKHPEVEWHSLSVSVIRISYLEIVSDFDIHASC
jgi:hypothetical protein